MNPEVCLALLVLALLAWLHGLATGLRAVRHLRRLARIERERAHWRGFRAGWDGGAKMERFLRARRQEFSEN